MLNSVESPGACCSSLRSCWSQSVSSENDTGPADYIIYTLYSYHASSTERNSVRLIPQLWAGLPSRTSRGFLSAICTTPELPSARTFFRLSRFWRCPWWEQNRLVWRWLRSCTPPSNPENNSVIFWNDLKFKGLYCKLKKFVTVPGSRWIMVDRSLDHHAFWFWKLVEASKLQKSKVAFSLNGTYHTRLIIVRSSRISIPR